MLPLMSLSSAKSFLFIHTGLPSFVFPTMEMKNPLCIACNNKAFSKIFQDNILGHKEIFFT